ncbi:hypothetical protein NOVO_06535 [Rickettsiales bacterium Ac37b]|nr:hypothetical protein NOVO_06535 [Rickettsiales bacterium Ac37b]
MGFSQIIKNLCINIPGFGYKKLDKSDESIELLARVNKNFGVASDRINVQYQYEDEDISKLISYYYSRS